MTFDEIEKIFEGMLKIQQDIQVQQVKNTETIARIGERQEGIAEQQERITEQQEKNERAIARLTENVDNLNIVSQRHEDRLTYLYGYQQTADTDRLNIMQGVNDIRRRLNNIEERLNAG